MTFQLFDYYVDRVLPHSITLTLEHANSSTNRLSLRGEVSRERLLDNDSYESTLIAVRSSGLAGCVHPDSMQLRQLLSQHLCWGASWTSAWTAVEQGNYAGQGLAGSQGSGSESLAQHAATSARTFFATRSGDAFVVRWFMQLRQILLQHSCCGASWTPRTSQEHSRTQAQEALGFVVFVLGCCRALGVAVREVSLHAHAVSGVPMQLCHISKHFVARHLIGYVATTVCA